MTFEIIARAIYPFTSRDVDNNGYAVRWNNKGEMLTFVPACPIDGYSDTELVMYRNLPA